MCALARSSTTTPLDHVALNLLNCPTESHLQPVVLLTTGSYNPVHKMHIHTIAEAKKELETRYNMVVLGAFISPSHDRYVGNKLKTDAILGEHRLAMCDSAIQDAGYGEWLMVDRWECMNSNFIDFPLCVRTMKEYVNQRIVGNYQEIKVLYLCGSDLFLKCGQLRGLRNRGSGVVVLKRDDGSSLGMDQVLTSDPSTNLYVMKSNLLEKNDVSSTMIRTLKQKNEDYSYLTFPSVYEYMTRHNL